MAVYTAEMEFVALSGAQVGLAVVASRILEDDLLGAIFGECKSPIFEYTPLRASAGSLRSLAQKSPKPLEEKGLGRANWNRGLVHGGAKHRH